MATRLDIKVLRSLNSLITRQYDSDIKEQPPSHLDRFRPSSNHLPYKQLLSTQALKPTLDTSHETQHHQHKKQDALWLLPK